MDATELDTCCELHLENQFGDPELDTDFVYAHTSDLPSPIASHLISEFSKAYQACQSALQIDTLKRSFVVTATHYHTDIKWMNQQLDKLPEDTATTLKKTYFIKRKKYRSGRSANIWLRKRVASLKAIIGQFPLPIEHLSTEVKRAQIANEWSNRCLTILNQESEIGVTQKYAKSLLHAVQEPAKMWGFLPSLPDLSGFEGAIKSGEDITTVINAIIGAIARLIDEKWWCNQLNQAYKRFQEHAAIVIGKVRAGVSLYVSHKTFLEYQTKKNDNHAWIKLMELVNELHDLEMPLSDAVAASISNPELRRIELMVRMRGFEELAKAHGFVGEFYTWTAPSRYHSWIKSSSDKPQSNNKYRGANPRETQSYLCKQWAKARAKLDRNDIITFGFRVVEPHHDGTPHWHLLLFFKPEQLEQARQILCEYAVQHDKDELGIKDNKFTADDCKPRFDYQPIDANKGSATGYIAKYIAKNIDGAYVDVDYEAESSGKYAAQGVAAWASTWHIRQFQQIGGAPVTVWRELRRLRTAIDKDEPLEKARKAADAANWQGYIEANGGIQCKRDERPIKLAKKVEPEASKYGEDIQRIKGVFATLTVETRIEGWEIRNPNSESAKLDSDIRFEEVVDVLSSGSCAPWRSDNNCTPDISKPYFTQPMDSCSAQSRNDKYQKALSRLPIAEQKLAIECQRLGVDSQLLSQLKAGAVIHNQVGGDGLYIQVKQGELIVSQLLQGTHHDSTGNEIWRYIETNKRDQDETLDKQLRLQAWNIYKQGKDIEEWIATMEPWIALRALKQLGEVVEQHQRQ